MNDLNVLGSIHWKNKNLSLRNDSDFVWRLKKERKQKTNKEAGKLGGLSVVMPLLMAWFAQKMDFLAEKNNSKHLLNAYKCTRTKYSRR